MSAKKTTEERFWEKVDKTEGCWNWTAALDTAGYGQFYFDKKNHKAHRVSFFFKYGFWPKVTRHDCDNPQCVNPNHLRDGSHKDNSDDMYKRDRNFSLKSKDIIKIREIEMSRTIIADVARDYSISESTARNIIDGSVRSDLPGARKIIRQKSRSKLSVEDIIAIKMELAADRYWGQINALAEKYGVTHSEISHIKSGYIHADVSIPQTN